MFRSVILTTTVGGLVGGRRREFNIPFAVCIFIHTVGYRAIIPRVGPEQSPHKLKATFIFRESHLGNNNPAAVSRNLRGGVEVVLEKSAPSTQNPQLVWRFEPQYLHRFIV